MDLACEEPQHSFRSEPRSFPPGLATRLTHTGRISAQTVLRGVYLPAALTQVAGLVYRDLQVKRHVTRLTTQSPLRRDNLLHSMNGSLRYPRLMSTSHSLIRNTNMIFGQ